jgi:hypothetical protein
MKYGVPPLRAHAAVLRDLIISVILALVAVLMHYAHVSIPLVGASHVFDVLMAAYVVMLIGVLFKGI